MTSTPGAGWQVRIEHPGTGHVLEPAIAGEIQQTPTTRAQPRIEIPVRKRDKWRRLVEEFSGERIPMTVWHDGREQPIDALEDVTDTPRGATLVGRGGLGLESDVRREFIGVPYYQAARTIIDEDTPYTANVDEPVVSVDADVPIQEASTTAEFDELLDREETLPLRSVSDTVVPAQTAFTAEGEDFDSGSEGFVNDDYYDAGDFSDRDAARLSRGPNATGGPDEVAWRFAPDYTIPADEFGFAVRSKTAWDPATDTGPGGPGLEWYLDHANGSSYQLANQEVLGFKAGLGWTTMEGAGIFSGYDGPDLEPGQHEVRCLVTDSGGQAQEYGYYVDVIAPFDRRYSITLDETLNSQDALSGPELYPGAVEARFIDARTVRSVPAATLTTSIDDTSGSQALALSNDLGQSYTSASNATSLSANFADAGPSIRAKVTLGRHGSRTDQTPTEGYLAQTLSQLEVRADLSDIRTISRQQVEGSAATVLRQLAEDANALWEFRRAPGGDSVEWSRPGQRVADREASVSDYRLTTRTSDVIKEATVKGASQRVEGEQITADHGTAVDLAHGDIQAAKAVVRDPESGEQYASPRDYQLDALDGTVSTNASGRIADGTPLLVDYQWRPKATYRDPDATPPLDPTLTATYDIANLTTIRGCGQAALRLVQDLSEPVHVATVTLPSNSGRWSVVESVDLAQLPGDGVYEILSSPTGPRETELELATREDAQAIIDDIRDSVASVTREV